MRPTSILSSEKSRPSTSTPVPNAICSFSSKKFSTLRLSVIVPTWCSGKAFSGQTFVSSSGSKSSSGWSSSLIICTCRSHCGCSPASIDREEVLGVRPEVLGLDRGGVGRRPAADRLPGQPVVLDQHRLAGRVDPLVGVDAEALLVAVGRRDPARAEQDRDHVQRLGGGGPEVEDTLGLLLERDGVGLLRVDEVGELHRVADEEHREVVADQVPVAVLGVELHREAAGVARGLGGVAAAGHRREAHGDLGLLAGLLEELGPRELRDRLVAALAGRLEDAERGRAAGVDDALGDPLAIEVADLLDEVVVLERRRAARADRALVLVVGDRVALAGGQFPAVVVAHAALRSSVVCDWQSGQVPQ